MLNIVDIKVPCELEFGTPFTFPLDNFQKYAIHAIHNNENVLVTAKTGSGKTLVGEYQIHHSLSKNKRVFYTTPIKSLSNQKFHDLRKQFGNERVGIVTGDIKFCPQADIIVMTTEILCNLLYKRTTSTKNVGVTAGMSLENLDAVIFDEVHYINDPERGRVWEETMILLDPSVNLVLLSATIDSPEHFATWLSQIKNKTVHLISTEYRIVPLTHYITDENYNLITLMDSKNRFDDKVYRDFLKQKQKSLKDQDDHQERVKNREEGQVIQKATRLVSFQHRMNSLITKLKADGMLPALFFVFSRKDCEKYAKNVEETLIDSSDSAAVRHIINFHLHHYSDRLENLSQYHSLFDLLLKGVAYHHSGLLPLLKEIVEILFSKGYIKVMFATETFAVGINMPTKTVVFLDYKKYDDRKENLRVLRTDEYIQMAGRAGRRGIDTLGTVIYLPVRTPLSLEEVKRMMTGMNSCITSRMSFGYEFILKSLHSGVSFDEIINNSHFKFQIDQENERLLKENDRLMDLQTGLNLNEYLSDLHRKRELESSFKTKEIQRELSTWNNRHVGPKWAQAIKSYTQWVKYHEEITSNVNSIVISKETPLEANLQFLTKMGFIIEQNGVYTLTKKGVLATEINESHPLLLTESYSMGLLDHLSHKEICGFLAIFIGKSRDDEPSPEVSDVTVHKCVQAFEAIRTRFEKYSVSSQLGGVRNDWLISTEWVNPVMDWMEGKHSQLICQEYDLFPGNLYRSIISISNMVEELITVCTLDQNAVMLEKMSYIKPLLSRDIAIPESLYLRL